MEETIFSESKMMLRGSCDQSANYLDPFKFYSFSHFIIILENKYIDIIGSAYLHNGINDMTAYFFCILVLIQIKI